MKILTSETQYSNTKHATSSAFVLEEAGEVVEVPTLRAPIITVQVTDAFTGELVFEASNTGTDWHPYPLLDADGAYALSATAPGIWGEAPIGVYFRVRADTLTAGTPGVAVLTSNA